MCGSFLPKDVKAATTALTSWNHVITAILINAPAIEFLLPLCTSMCIHVDAYTFTQRIYMYKLTQYNLGYPNL